MRGTGAGLYAGLTDLEGELRKRAATFEPQPAAVAAYDDSYASWRHIYPGMLEPVRGGPAQTRSGGRRGARAARRPGVSHRASTGPTRA